MHSKQFEVEINHDCNSGVKELATVNQSPGIMQWACIKNILAQNGLLIPPTTYNTTLQLAALSAEFKLVYFSVIESSSSGEGVEDRIRITQTNRTMSFTRDSVFR